MHRLNEISCRFIGSRGFCKANDTFNYSNLIGSAAKSLSAATNQMTDVRSRITTWSKAGFILLSSRHFLCVGTASVFFAACALVLPASAQNTKSPARKKQTGHSAAEDGRNPFVPHAMAWIGAVANAGPILPHVPKSNSCPTRKRCTSCRQENRWRGCRRSLCWAHRRSTR